MNHYSILIVTFGFVAGCASESPPALTAENPASPSAPEAASGPLRYALMPDNLTKKTRELFAQARKQEEQPSPTPAQGENGMGQMPGMKTP